jgi:hypothetical protein
MVTSAVGLLPATGARAGPLGVVFVLLVLAFFTVPVFIQTKDEVGLAQLGPRALVVAFDILCLIGVIIDYGDLVWNPPE